ncbi:uncharacterized protein [Battus philenor]|uniref:uncharacterized protein n=1 Tax=Battus philenor TaxID=42288 RepID=UPI0035D04170
MRTRCSQVLLVLLLQHFGSSRRETAAGDGSEVLRQCEANVNASLSLERDDRLLRANWTAELRVRQVAAAAHRRLEHARHAERAYRRVKSNDKWNECLKLHGREVRHSKNSYYDGERECLRVASSADSDKTKTVTQVEKEIKKWRKSYKYLSNLCEVNHPGDRAAAEGCLVEYIKRDNYDSTFERLILLKLEAMSDLLQRMNSSLQELDECLKKSLAESVQGIRTVMEVLKRCYSRNTDE